MDLLVVWGQFRPNSSKRIFFIFRELEQSAKLIEDLTRSGSVGDDGGKSGGGGKRIDPVQKSLMEVRGQLKSAQEKIRDLETDKKEAEENAR